MTAVEAGATRPRGSQDLASMLFGEPPAVLDVPAFAWGFGGMHGGLALSLAASSARRGVPDHALRSITGHFHRPIRETLAIESRVIRSGRATAAVHIVGSAAGSVCLTATAVFGSDQAGTAVVYAPEAPDVPGPDSVAPLEGLADDVPVLGQVDVRPVTPIRLYAGASDPTMTAWLRLKGEERPLDPYGLVFFLDALPPSYAAALTRRRPVPTLEFSAHLTPTRSASPWVLVRSRTVRAGEGGWVTESVDAWDAEGAHVGSAQQLRLALADRSSAGA